MVALNGTQVNGVDLNGAWAAPSTLCRGDHAPTGEIPPMGHFQPDDVLGALADDLGGGSSSRPVTDSLDAERARLEFAVAAAVARAAAASERAAARHAEVQAMLRAEVVASQEALAEMERQHDAAIARVRASAEAEVERILAEARRAATGSAGAEQETADGR